VIAVKDDKGRIKLNQLLNTTAVGAVSGTFWGTLIGLIFLMPLAGAAIGATSGAIGGALSDVGINDKWMKETAAAIQPGTAALFVLVRKVTADKVLEGLKGEGGTVMKTSLDHTKEAALQAALAGVQARCRPPPSENAGDRCSTDGAPACRPAALGSPPSYAAGFLILSRIGPIRPVVAKAHFSRIAVRPQSPCGRLKIFAHQPW
jgi:uncharacterized membrane protein